MGILKLLSEKIIAESSRHLGLFAVASLSVMTVSLSTIAYQGYKDSAVQEEITETNKHSKESRFQQVFYNNTVSSNEKSAAEDLSVKGGILDTAESREDSEFDSSSQKENKKKNNADSSEQEEAGDAKAENERNAKNAEEGSEKSPESSASPELNSAASSEAPSNSQEAAPETPPEGKKNAPEASQESGESAENGNNPPAESLPKEDLNDPTPVPLPAEDEQTPPVLPTKSDPFENYYGSSTFNDYNVYLDTALGSMPYYNQHDSHWRDFLYGGTDSISKYGCGPTTAAMIVSAFGNVNGSITPKEMANWSAAYGYFAPKSGSYHEYIPAVLSAFDLIVDTVKAEDRTTAHLQELLNSGHICVALMGKGALTKGGHFIIITKQNANGTVAIADPNSYPNTQKEWNPEQLLRELKKNYDAGGPLWSVAVPNT